MNRLALVSIVASALVSGCSNAAVYPQGSAQTYSALSAVQHSNATANIGEFKHLYEVSNETINEYNLPLTANPTPVVTLPLPLAGPNLQGCVAANSTALYVACDGGLYVYPLPLIAGERASVKDTSFSAAAIAVTDDTLYEFPHFLNSPKTLKAFALPYVAGEAPSATVVTSTVVSEFTAGSHFLNLFGLNGNKAVLQSYALPLMAGESPTATVQEASAEPFIGQYADKLYQLYLVNIHGVGGIEVFQLPLTASSTPIKTQVFSVFVPLGIAPNGHYVYVLGDDDKVRIYKLPLSANDRAFLTAHVSPIVNAIVFGP